MIPILYEATETAFVSNGLGRLRDCISCVVTEERNGIYECDFEYPLGGGNFGLIKEGRIIAVEHDDTGDVQPFVIMSHTKPISGICTFHAVHLSYKQSGLVVSGTGIQSLAAAFALLETAEPPNPFVYETDKTSTAYMAAADGTPRTVRQMLGGIEGSILDTYGGEYEWDRWKVKLHTQRGVVRDLTIRYGVNLMDYTDDTDYSGAYTAATPFWKSSNGTLVKGGMVSAGYASYSGTEINVPLDLSEKFESKPTVAELENMARSLLIQKQTHLPSQSIKVDFVRLQDSPEFEQYEPLFKCKLCDTINLELPMYGVKGTIRIVKTVWDVLQERYQSLELGTLSISLSEALGITGPSTASGSSPAGTVVSASGSYKTSTAGVSNWATGPSITLTEGTWIIVGRWNFQSIGATARHVAVRIYSVTQSGNIQSMYVPCGHGYTTVLPLTCIVTISEDITYRLDGAASVTGEAATTQVINAVRIA